MLAVVALATAVSLLLAVLYVRYRDVQPLWEVLLQLLFWGSPIIYTIEAVPASVRELMMLSPLAVAIQQGRHWLVESSTDSAGAGDRRHRAATRAARDLRRDRAPELVGLPPRRAADGRGPLSRPARG